MSDKIIDDPWRDNQEAHDAINRCLEVIAARLKEIETYVVELPTPNKILYKPKGAEDYLDMRGNYDEIYKRLEDLEGKVNGMQN
ncbi:hypothetical protein [Synechococcus phage S-H25]|nr:hypothetical protein [Synechococcus phage S-H25]